MQVEFRLGSGGVGGASPRKLFARAALVFFVPTLILVIIYFFMSYTNHNKDENYQPVQAEIVNYDVKYSNRMHRRSKITISSPSYAPVYKYVYEGMNYQEEGDTYSQMRIYNIGDRVEIKVNPDKPEKVYDPLFAAKFQRYFVTHLIIPFGAVFIGLLCAAIFNRKRS